MPRQPPVGYLAPGIPLPGASVFSIVYIVAMDRYQQNMKGFTLVELLVAMVVVAVVLVIGVPGIANLKRNSELITATKDLVAALNLARAEAVRQGTNILVASKAGDADTDFTTGWHVKSGGTVLREFYDIPTGTSVTLTSGTAPITFSGLGNVTAAACFDITVDGSSAVRSVPIEPTGRITTDKSACP